MSNGGNLVLPIPTGQILVSTFNVTDTSTFTASPGTMTFTGNFTVANTATFNANGGHINFNPSSSTTFSCGNAIFNTVTLNSSISGSGSLTINSNCNLPLGNNPNVGDIGTLNLLGTLSGSGTFTATNVSTIILQSTSSLNGFNGLNTRTINISGKAYDFSSFSTFNLNGGSIDVSNAGTLILPSSLGMIQISALDLNDTSTFTTPSAGIAVNNNFFVDSGVTFNQNGPIVLNPNTNVTYECGNKTFSDVSLSQAYYLSGAITLQATCTFNIGNNPSLGTFQTFNLYGTLVGSGTLDASSITTLGFYSTANLNGFSGLNSISLTVSSANMNFSSYSPFTLSGTINVSSAGTLVLPTGSINAASVNITSGSTFTAPPSEMTVNSTFFLGSDTTFNHNNGSIRFIGGTATIACNNKLFNNVSFTGQTDTKTVLNNCTLPLGESPIIPDDLTLSDVLSGTGKLTTIGSFTLNSGSSISGFNELETGHILLNGGTLDLSTYSNVVINNTLNLSSGTFTAPSTISVKGNFQRGTATFNHNNGTVVLNGNSQDIVGSTTFYNLTKEITTDITNVILEFQNGTTQTIL